jgi:hypothetical protein
MTDKWPTESLSEAEARLRHPDCEMVAVFSIVDQDGEWRAAIFVWQREETSDEEDPVEVPASY